MRVEALRWFSNWWMLGVRIAAQYPEKSHSAHIVSLKDLELRKLSRNIQLRGSSFCQHDQVVTKDVTVHAPGSSDGQDWCERCD